MSAHAAPVREGSLKVGIVSTHRAWTAESQAWARYHLGIGFDRLYVFVDDGQLPSASPPPAVELTPCTPAYWSSHSPKRGYEDYLHEVRRDVGGPLWGSPERVMQRQILNACEAMERAAEEGVDWLLHIDDDEYFWCPGSSAAEHFRCLHGAGLAFARYVNHEAVLIAEESPAPHSQALFKKHWLGLTAAQQAALPGLLPGKPYYSSHASGKTAVRVDPGTRPSTVHVFEMADPMNGEAILRMPAVLHRPYKSVGHFCDKHLSQGVFPMETALGSPYVPPGVYREVHRLVREQDLDGLRALYAQAVLWSRAETERLQADGYLLSLQAPWAE